MRSRENRRWTRASTLMLAVAFIGTHVATPSRVHAQQEADAVVKSPIDGIVLTDLAGEKVRLSDLTGQPLILVLGELSQRRTQRVCADLSSLLTTPEMQAIDVSSVLIMTRNATVDGSGSELDETQRPETTLLDPKRDAFGAFRVIVLPTIVVLDNEGQLIHSMPGIVPRMPEIVLAAVRLAKGDLTKNEFELILDPPPKVELTEEQKRAVRLAKMAGQLRTKGMLEAAAKQYEEAIALDPTLIGAGVGLGRVMFDQGMMEQALDQFRAALKVQPDSIEALLGAAFVQVASGEEGVLLAQKTALHLIESSPGNAQVHFLLGLVHQAQGKCEEACAAFKHAAELLLNQR